MKDVAAQEIVLHNNAFKHHPLILIPNHCPKTWPHTADPGNNGRK